MYHYIPYLAVLVLAGMFLYVRELDLQNLGYMIHYKPDWPLPLFYAKNGLALLLHKIADEISPAPFKVVEHSSGPFVANVIYTVTKLNLAELLFKSPKSIEELSALTAAKDQAGLLRLLRAAQSIGYFKEDSKTGLWSNTRYSAVLHPRHPSSQHFLVLHWKDDFYGPLGLLYDNIVDPTRDVYTESHGLPFWDNHEAHPELHHQFQNALINLGSLTSAAVSEDYKWEQHTRVVDYAGGTGLLLSQILRDHRTLMVCSLPACIHTV